MRLSFLIFTEIMKLNTCKMFCNHQIPKLNTRKMFFFSSREIKYPGNLIPLRLVYSTHSGNQNSRTCQSINIFL